MVKKLTLEHLFIEGLVMAALTLGGAYLYGVYGGIGGLVLGAIIGLAIVSTLPKPKNGRV